MQEDQIIAGLKIKDRMTTEYVYKKYSWALFAVISRVIIDKDEAEIVFHDSFVQIVLKIGDFAGSSNRLYTWMADICREVANENLRSKDFSKSA